NKANQCDSNFGYQLDMREIKMSDKDFPISGSQFELYSFKVSILPTTTRISARDLFVPSQTICYK
ncbi:MAG: hypothetical protein NZ822_03170, partial [Patescibacteria group bacterium]|nr:hypothetical protein [Patescibacteria group bacterium]